MIDDVQSAAKHDDREREFPPLDILLVEDSVVIRTVLAGLLERAEDGPEFRAQLEKQCQAVRTKLDPALEMQAWREVLYSLAST